MSLYNPPRLHLTSTPDDDVEVKLLVQYNRDGCRHPNVQGALGPDEEALVRDSYGGIAAAFWGKGYTGGWCYDCKKAIIVDESHRRSI